MILLLMQQMEWCYLFSVKIEVIMEKFFLCDASILMGVHKAFRKFFLFYVSANFPLSSYQNTSFLVSPINSSFRRSIISFRFNSAIYLITFQFPERRFPSLIRTPFSCSLGRIRLIVPIVIPV